MSRYHSSYLNKTLKIKCYVTILLYFQGYQKEWRYWFILGLKGL